MTGAGSTGAPRLGAHHGEPGINRSSWGLGLSRSRLSLVATEAWPATRAVIACALGPLQPGATLRRPGRETAKSFGNRSASCGGLQGLDGRAPRGVEVGVGRTSRLTGALAPRTGPLPT